MYKITEKVALNPTVTKMVIEAPLIAKKAKPGQFIIVRPFEDSERIPLTVAGYDREKGTVDIIFQIVGATTEKLNHLEEGDSLHDFVGPLGIASHAEGLKKVAVIGGGMVGCETAEYLAARGCKVSVIEMMDKIAAGESTTILPTLLENYKTYGVEQYPSHKVKEFRMDAVVCENKDGAEVTIPCDYIVLAMGARSNEFDAAALEAASIPVYSIGDAAGKAADISNAIRTGYDTACQL